MAVILLGGGARSGKSGFALRYVQERFAGGVLVATGEAGDEEMRDRIARHKADRGPFWRTVEEPLDLAGALQREAGRAEAGCAEEAPAEGIVVDCLTLWLSNVLLAPELDEETEIDRLEAVLAGWQGPTLLLVTNEVGCGIVPMNALSRRFRDLAGMLNQRAAVVADEVYWLVFGQPLRIKPSGSAPWA